MSNEAKRKTHTSTEVKNRYNNKVYSQLAVKLPKDLVSDFKEKCTAEGVPQARIIKKAIEDFLKNTDEN